MMRLILSLALTLASAGACAAGNYYGEQTNTYNPVGATTSDADLQAATAACDARLGVVPAGQDTPDAYKQCMLAQGWQLDCTIPPDAYPDAKNLCRPCRNFVVLGMVGQECG